MADLRTFRTKENLARSPFTRGHCTDRDLRSDHFLSIMKRRRSQNVVARPGRNKNGSNFLCDILPPEVRVCYLYPCLIDVGLNTVNCLARTCKVLCEEMMHDKRSPFFVPRHWWKICAFQTCYGDDLPAVDRVLHQERATRILGEFLVHKTECKMFDGLTDEQILEIRFNVQNNYRNNHTMKFTLYVDQVDECEFVYHFPFLLDERPMPPVPAALCGITSAPILPSREAVDTVKAQARAAHAARIEQQKREARIPQTLRDEQRELVRSRSDAMATVNSMSYEGTSFRHNGRPSLGDIDRVIIAYQQGAEAAKRLRAIEERLADIAREMEIFRSSD